MPTTLAEFAKDPACSNIITVSKQRGYTDDVILTFLLEMQRRGIDPQEMSETFYADDKLSPPPQVDTLKQQFADDTQYQKAVDLARQRGYSDDDILMLFQAAQKKGISGTEIAKSFEDQLKDDLQIEALRQQIVPGIFFFRVLLALVIELFLFASPLLDSFTTLRWGKNFNLAFLWSGNFDISQLQAMEDPSAGWLLGQMASTLLILIVIWFIFHALINFLVKFVVQMFSGFFAKAPYRSKRSKQLRSIPKKRMRRVFSGASYYDSYEDIPQSERLDAKNRVIEAYQPIFDKIDGIVKEALSQKQENNIHIWTFSLYLLSLITLTILVMVSV